MRAKLVLFFLVFFVSSSAFSQDLTELYSSARLEIEKNNCQQAIERLKLLLDRDYILKDYVAIDLATCYLKLDKKTEGFNLLLEIINNYNSSPMIKKAYSTALGIATKEDLDKATMLAETYIAKFGYDDDVSITAMDVIFKNNRLKAIELLKDLFLKGGKNIDYAYDKLKALGISLTKEEFLKGLNAAYTRKNYRKIITLLKDDAGLDKDVKLLLGKAYFAVRNYNATIRYLIDTPYREGMIVLTDAFLRTGDRLAAEVMFRRLSEKGETGLYGLYLRFAEIKRREGRYADAKNIFTKLLTSFPEKRAETLWYLAWLSVSNKNYADAENYLRELLKEERYADKDKVFFWLGKVSEYQGKSGSEYFSKLKGSKSYYAFQLNLASNFNSNFDNENVQTDILPEGLKLAYLRAEELSKVSLSEFASAELKMVGKQVNKQYLPIIAKLLIKISDYATLIRLAEMTGEINVFSYPAAYLDYLNQVVKEEKIDKFLALAVMREESRFNPKTVSVVGAVGLMQLMPETAFRYISRTSLDDIFIPENNIKIGVKHLARLLKDYKNYYYAVAAYNAGEHRVNNWLKKGYTDIDEFVEDIPFGETKDYVKKVMKSYFIYKKLYTN